MDHSGVRERIHVLEENTFPDDVLKSIALSGLKDSKMTIREDLTPFHLTADRKAVAKYRLRWVWTQDWRIQWLNEHGDQGVATCEVTDNPFLIMDVGDVVKKHLKWKLKMPRVVTFYAVKCNDNRVVLEVLAALGTGFDCASDTEIAKVLDLGVDPSRIIFANPTKMPSHIRYANSRNVNTMTFDNESELYKVKALHPNARMVLRIRCDSHKADFILGNKFGCDVKTKPSDLLKLAVTLGVNVVGVCFHVGSGCWEHEAFRRGISAAREIFDIGSELGFTMDLLDIGGGFPGNHDSSIDEFADVINTALEDFFPAAEMKDVKVISEPGTYYVASAFTLATQIHSKRGTMYYINDSVFGCLSCVLLSHVNLSPFPLVENPGKLQKSILWGTTLDGTDLVAKDLMLPPLDIGDWLIFQDMGAYSITLATNFNGFLIPEVYAVVDKSLWRSLKDQLPLTEEHFTFSKNWKTEIE